MCVYVCMYVCIVMYVCMNVYICIYIYIYICMYIIHRYIYMYTFQVMCLDLNQNCALSGATTRSQVYASAAACLDAMDLRELRNEYGRM